MNIHPALVQKSKEKSIEYLFKQVQELRTRLDQVESQSNANTSILLTIQSNKPISEPTRYDEVGYNRIQAELSRRMGLVPSTIGANPSYTIPSTRESINEARRGHASNYFTIATNPNNRF